MGTGFFGFNVRIRPWRPLVVAFRCGCLAGELRGRGARETARHGPEFGLCGLLNGRQRRGDRSGHGFRGREGQGRVGPAPRSVTTLSAGGRLLVAFGDGENRGFQPMVPLRPFCSGRRAFRDRQLTTFFIVGRAFFFAGGLQSSPRGNSSFARQLTQPVLFPTQACGL